MAKLIGLFPTPFLKIDGFAEVDALEEIAARADAMFRGRNSATDKLSHTELLDPASDPFWTALGERIAPHLVGFGEVLFADNLRWSIKEIWVNVLERGGSQFMHTHANSFISGVLFVNKPHDSARTVFRKPAGGAEYIFKNDVPLGHYSSDTWVVPEINPGDMVLYPSYLLHGVPPNEGDRRVTVAFNAIPDTLSSLGYAVRFSKA